MDKKRADKPRRREASRPEAYRPADEADRPTEDDVAQDRLGGPRGAPELRPAPMTRQRRIKTPESDPDPGHTA